MTERGKFLLVAVPSPEVAARTNGVLRRAGIDVQVVHASRLAEAERLLHEFQPFLALYHPAVADDLPLEEFTELLAAQGTFLAVPTSAERACELATDHLTIPAIPLQDDDDQLIALVRSLAGDHGTTPAGEDPSRLEQELRGDPDRAMRDEDIPVAVVNAGLHVAANPAYLRAMGLKSFDLLLGVSLLDILESPGINLKQLLRSLSRGEFPDAPLHCTVRPALNRPFHGALLFDPVRFEGEDCVQVLVRLSEAHTDIPAAPTTATDASTNEPNVEPSTADRGSDAGEPASAAASDETGVTETADTVADHEPEPAQTVESPESSESFAPEADETVADRESEPAQTVESPASFESSESFAPEADETVADRESEPARTIEPPESFEPFTPEANEPVADRESEPAQTVESPESFESSESFAPEADETVADRESEPAQTVESPASFESSESFAPEVEETVADRESEPARTIEPPESFEPFTPEANEPVTEWESEPTLIIDSPATEVLEFFESMAREADETEAEREPEAAGTMDSPHDESEAVHASDCWPLAEPQAGEHLETPEPAPTSHPAPESTPEATAEPAITADETPEPPPVMAPKEAAVRTHNVDPLTGLMSRPAFMQWLEAWIEGLEDSQRGGVLYIAPEKPDRDLEGRSISEHDDYERSIARVVSRYLQEHEGASRFRDNAFTMAVTRGDRALIRELASELREAVEALAQEEPLRPMPSACSIGYVTVDPSMHDAEGAVAQALEAWRDAAAKGQEVARYRPPLGAELDDTEEAAWVSRIRHALHNDEFLTVQYDVTNLDGEAEGLVENRTCLHDDEGNIPTETFLPVAERSGLASQIDRLVIPGLLRAIADGTDRHIITISNNSLQDFSFPSWLRREMQSVGIEGRRLVLQCSVDAARDHAKAARRLVEELEPTGCLFSLSNMNGEARNRATVGQFRPTYLRLDAELTKDLRGHPQHVDQINAVVRDARGHAAITMASDVDNSSDLAALWQCGVKLVTGDFLQKSPKVIGA